MWVPSTAVGPRMYFTVPSWSQASSIWSGGSTMPRPVRFAGLVQSSFSNAFVTSEVTFVPPGCSGVPDGLAVGLPLGLADGLGVLRAGGVQMSAKVEATLDLFIEQSVGAVLGMAIMMAFEVAREANIPAEALVLEMYMSGEMEAVFQAFRETGFFRASEDHGPTAVFGGITRSLEMDREAMAERFRHVLEDIKSGGFAQRFQDEARNGYPMLEFARAMMHGGSPMAEAEERIRHLAGPDRAAPGAGGPA